MFDQLSETLESVTITAAEMAHSCCKLRNIRYKAITASLLVVAILFGGCSNIAAVANSRTHGGSNELLPIEAESIELVHLLGVGAWATNITLFQDGSFWGHYYDTNMGEVGDGYPGGTEYTCDFSGRLQVVKQVNDYTYRMILNAMETDVPGKWWIEDGVLFITAEPVGVAGGNTFLLYTPDAPLEQLPEGLLFWWQLRYADTDDANRLGVFALYNDTSHCGFFPVFE